LLLYFCKHEYILYNSKQKYVYTPIKNQKMETWPFTHPHSSIYTSTHGMMCKMRVGKCPIVESELVINQLL
jgi:hypothetical protein